MQRPTVVTGGVPGVGGMVDEGFVKKFPIVSQYLTDAMWEDDKPRETSSLAFTVKEGLWQVALNDKALKQSFYSTAESMMEALKLLEKALGDGIAAWRPWKRGK